MELNKAFCPLDLNTHYKSIDFQVYIKIVENFRRHFYLSSRTFNFNVFNRALCSFITLTYIKSSEIYNKEMYEISCTLTG